MDIVVHLSDEDIAEIARGGEVTVTPGLHLSKLIKNNGVNLTGIVVRKKKEEAYED